MAEPALPPIPAMESRVGVKAVIQGVVADKTPKNLTDLEKRVIGTLRQSKEITSRESLIEVRKQVRKQALPSSALSELRGRFSADATTVDGSKTLDVASGELIGLYDKYLRNGYDQLLQPEKDQIDIMVKAGIDRNPDFKGAFTEKRAAEIADDPRVRLQIKRGLAEISADKALQNAKSEYDKAKPTDKPAKLEAYKQAQAESFDRMQALMGDGVEAFLDAETEPLLKALPDTIKAELKLIQTQEASNLYVKLREAQRNDKGTKIDKKKVNQHWRDLVDKGPEAVLRQLGYTDEKQIARLAPQLTEMVLERKLNRTFWPPKVSEIKDFMETPWGKKMVEDGGGSDALQKILARTGLTDRFKNLISGRSKWKGRTGALALAALVAAASVASATKEE